MENSNEDEIRNRAVRNSNAIRANWSQYQSASAMGRTIPDFNPFILDDDMAWAKKKTGKGRASIYFTEKIQKFMNDNPNKWICVYEEQGLPMETARKLANTLRSSAAYFGNKNPNFKYKVVTKGVGNVLLAAGLFDTDDE